MSRRRRKPDPNQGELFPGFNMGGSTPGRPSGAPVGFTGMSGAPGSPVNAGEAYRAAQAALNPPKPPQGGIPGFTGRPLPPNNYSAPASSGWTGMAQRALSAPRGVSPLAAIGPAGAAVDLGLRGVRGAFRPTPYGNFDTKVVQNLSGEGQDQWYGRGTDRPGLYAANTSKKFADANGRSVTTNPREIRDYYPEEHVGGPESVATGTIGGGIPQQPAGLHPPGPAADYMHQSQTSGTGTPWFDTHTATTSGLNTPGVQPIRAQTDE